MSPFFDYNADVITTVELTKQAMKDLKKVPLYIQVKFQRWLEDVEMRGIEEVRKVPGYHDEPLRGDHNGQRSIRLSQAYRAFYRIANGEIELIEVLEVNKHEY